MPTSATTVLTPRADLLASVEKATLDFNPIGLQIMPPTPVPLNRGKYGIIPVAAMLDKPVVIRQRKSGSARSTWDYTDASYATKGYSFEEITDDGDRARYATMFDYERVLAGRCRSIILRNQEFRIATAVQSTSTFTGANGTLAVVNKWSNAANADPIGDVNRGKIAIRAKCGMTPNVLQIAWRTVLDLSLCDQLRETVKYTSRVPGVSPLQALADALGVAKIVTPGDGNVYNSANEGATATVAEIWDATKAGLYVVASGPDMAAPSVGRTFYWEPDGGLMTVEQYRDETVRSDVYRVIQSVDENLISSDFGFVFTNVS